MISFVNLSESTKARDLGSVTSKLHKLIVLHFKAFCFCSMDTQYSLKDFPASVILFNLPKMFSIASLLIPDLML